MRISIYRNKKRLGLAVTGVMVLAIVGAVVGTGGHQVVAASSNLYVCPDTLTPCTGADTTIHPKNFDKIQDALDAVAASENQGETTIWVQKGQTFNEDLVFKSNNVNLRGAEPGGPGVPGSTKSIVYSNGNSPYGVEVTGRKNLEIRYLAFRVGQEDTTLRYHLKVYNTSGLYMRHDDFYGPGKDSSQPVTGMDFNSSVNITQEQNKAQDYSKNGIAVTAKFNTDSMTSKNYRFRGVLSSNNGWNGLAFYTHSGPSNPFDTSANINQVSFESYSDGTVNEFRNNNQSGIFVQGAKDADVATLANPDKKVSENGTGTPLDVTNVHFSGNFGFDIFNYQANDVTAAGGFYRPIPSPTDLVGSSVSASPFLKTVQNNKFFDKLDSSNLGTVNF